MTVFLAQRPSTHHLTLIRLYFGWVFVSMLTAVEDCWALKSGVAQVPAMNHYNLIAFVVVGALIKI